MTKPKFSVASWMTPQNSILDDIEQTAELGGDGVGLWEGKFEELSLAQIEDALASAKLRATFCMPSVWTILPSPVADPSVEDPGRRTEAICHSIARLSELDPIGIVVGPGVSGDPARPTQRLDLVTQNLGVIADVASEHGVRIAFELLARRRGAPFATIDELSKVIADAGRDDVDMFIDVWHSWPESQIHDQLRHFARRVVCLQVNDVREVERSWADRLIPGEGRNVCLGFLIALLEAQYDGWFELEVMSDSQYEDSLWRIPHRELLKMGKQAFERVYEEAQEHVADSAR